MKYYPMAMHLHSIHQPGASMASHMFNAQKLGMKYIHFTDHVFEYMSKNKGQKQLDDRSEYLNGKAESHFPFKWA